MIFNENKSKQKLQQGKSEIVKEIGKITNKKDKEDNQEQELDLERDKVLVRAFRANSL